MAWVNNSLKGILIGVKNVGTQSRGVTNLQQRPPGWTENGRISLVRSCESPSSRVSQPDL